jgi:molecular chaperone IbpA
MQRFLKGCPMRIDHTPFFRSTVGFDRLLDLLETAGEQGYPPYNIERSDENNYRVTLAVAGFAEKDLSVDVKDRVLTVSGKREEADKAQSAFLHQGIAGRAFERSFQLAEHVEVKAARLENGLLHVDLERIVPEEKKPRRIQINAPELKTIEGSKAA